MIGWFIGLNVGYEMVYVVFNLIDDEEFWLLLILDCFLCCFLDLFVLLWSGGYNIWCDLDFFYEVVDCVMIEVL